MCIIFVPYKGDKEMAQLTDRYDDRICHGHPETCTCDMHNGGNVNATPKPTEFKSYKGFRIYRDRLYIKESDIDQDKHYELKSGNLVELYKYADKSVYVLEEYYGNGTLESAIDVYIECKDLPIPKQPNSLVFDFWFNY